MGKSIYFLLRWKSKKRSKLKNLLQSKKQKQFIFCFDIKAKSKANKICFLLFHKKQKQDVFIWVAFLRNLRLEFLVIFTYWCCFFSFCVSEICQKMLCFPKKAKKQFYLLCHESKKQSKWNLLCFEAKSKILCFFALLSAFCFCFAQCCSAPCRYKKNNLIKQRYGSLWYS